MEEYLIKPWDTPAETEAASVDWDMQVPPEVDAIAEKVIRRYDMSVHQRTLITSKPDKGGAIWRIETDKGPRSLKVLHRTPERSLFSVGLQEYVVQQGARVPALISDLDGKKFVEMGGKLWIVTDWIDLQPATKVDLVGAQELCYGLGEFHRHTKGYVPPFGAKNSSRLHRWPNYYQKIAKKIGWMRDMANSYRDTQASASILNVVDSYEQQAVEAQSRLQQSAYSKMVAMGGPHWGLVHQDYGWSNGQNGPGGLWVIDLDGVAYDLPFRDLRKLITSTMDDMGVWDIEWIRGMIDAYHQANPLDLESFEVLLIDMAMPNEFYKHLKEMFFEPLTFLNTEADSILQRVVATDQTKWQALDLLSQDKGKYSSGNYAEAAVVKRPAQESQLGEQASWALRPQEKASQLPVVDVEEQTLVSAPSQEQGVKQKVVITKKRNKVIPKPYLVKKKRGNGKRVKKLSVKKTRTKPYPAKRVQKIAKKRFPAKRVQKIAKKRYPAKRVQKVTKKRISAKLRKFVPAKRKKGLGRLR